MSCIKNKTHFCAQANKILSILSNFKQKLLFLFSLILFQRQRLLLNGLKLSNNSIHSKPTSNNKFFFKTYFEQSKPKPTTNPPLSKRKSLESEWNWQLCARCFFFSSLFKFSFFHFIFWFSICFSTKFQYTQVRWCCSFFVVITACLSIEIFTNLKTVASIHATLNCLSIFK
jgi:hypothetical protein